MSITIFLEEEYGYRYWLWETGMDANALIKWWSELPAVNAYFFDPTGLPGTLTRLFDLTDMLVASTLSENISMPEMNQKLEVLIESDPIWIKVADKGGPRLDPDATHLDISALTGGWNAHIHMNDDSWIMPPGEEKVWLNQSES